MIFAIVLQRIQNKQASIENIVYKTQETVYEKIAISRLHLFEFNNFDQSIHLLDDDLNNLVEILADLDLFKFKEFFEIKKFKEETEEEIYKDINWLVDQYDVADINVDYIINKDKIIEDIVSSNEIKEMVEYFKTFSNEKKEFFYFSNFFKNIKEFFTQHTYNYIHDIKNYIEFFTFFNIKYDIPDNYEKMIEDGFSVLTNNFSKFNLVFLIDVLYYTRFIEYKKFSKINLAKIFIIPLIIKIAKKHKKEE